MASTPVLAVCLPQQSPTKITDSTSSDQGAEKIYMSGGAVLYVDEDTTVHNGEVVEAEKAEANPHKAPIHRKIREKQAKEKLKRKTSFPKQPHTTGLLRENTYAYQLYAGTGENQKLNRANRDSVFFTRQLQYREIGPPLRLLD